MQEEQERYVVFPSGICMQVALVMGQGRGAGACRSQLRYPLLGMESAACCSLSVKVRLL